MQSRDQQRVASFPQSPRPVTTLAAYAAGGSPGTLMTAIVNHDARKLQLRVART